MFTTQLLCGWCYVKFFTDIILVLQKPCEVGNTLRLNTVNTQPFDFLQDF